MGSERGRSTSLRHLAAAFLMAALLTATAVMLAEDDAPASEGNQFAPMHDVAYAFMVNKHGHWINENDDRLGFRDAILAANPGFLRVSTASNTCLAAIDPTKDDCDTGLPQGDPENPASPAGIFDKLRDEGIELGAAINVWRREYDGECETRFSLNGKEYCERTAREVVQHACQIRRRDRTTEPFYTWIFLDFALARPRGLQEIVDHIRSGDRCGGRGFARVMTNDTPYEPDQAREMATGVWGHAKRFELLHGERDEDGNGVDDWRDRAEAAARCDRPALMAEDRRFIEDVNDRYPHGHAVLKLEVPKQSGKFAKLDVYVQRSLLRQWAGAQEELRFKMIYPLYTVGEDDPDTDRIDYPVYDSRREDTHALQTTLIEKYDDPGADFPFDPAPRCTYGG